MYNNAEIALVAGVPFWLLLVLVADSPDSEKATELLLEISSCACFDCKFACSCSSACSSKLTISSFIVNSFVINCNCASLNGVPP